MDKLPTERIEYLNRFQRKSDKILCAVSYLLFQYGLKKEFNIVLNSYWQKEKNGKPYLDNYNEINFNISHCCKGTVCLFDDYRCGIDIQDISEISEDIIDIICSKKEIDEIKSSANPKRKICILWTLKESYVKYSGKGLTDEICNYDFSETFFKFERFGCCFSVFDMDSYIISVCSNKFFFKDELIKLKFSDLKQFPLLLTG